jgi:hypothetical protein
VTSYTLLNEAVHITGAFQLAGYQNVIGTLWPIGVRTASELAVNLYSQLTDGGAKPPDSDRAAWALHCSVRDLRSRYSTAPTLWAAYLHTGL